MDKNTRKRVDRLLEKHRALQNEMRNEIAEMLRPLPGMTLELTSPGFALVSGECYWEEMRVFGIRLKDCPGSGCSMELSTVCIYNGEDCQSSPSWDISDVLNESSGCISPDWPSLLEAACRSLEDAATR